MATLQGLTPFSLYDSMVPDFRGEALKETQNRLGHAQLQSLTMENQQAQQQAQQQQQFQQDWQQAYSSGDPKALEAIVAKYPGQMETVQKGMGFRDDNHRMQLGNAARDLRLAMASKQPGAVGQAAQTHAGTLASIGSSPEGLLQMLQDDPQGLARTVDLVGMSALGVKDYYDTEHKRDQLAETQRSNRASESLTARGQNISAQNSMRGAGGAVPASVREYQYFNSLSPEQQKTYMRVRGRPDAGGGDNTVQLADGRTVNVTGKLHGSGASAFYEGVDDAGNMVRVPASAIAAPATSAANAQNYAMKKDIDAISDADASQLDFMTGITGGSGSPSIDAEFRSRLPGSKEQRQLYNATKRIQGRMQNQGVAAARDMGASGINTVAEAKMYFQSMPQVDYSSPGSMQQSVRDIQEYTNNYNQQYQVDVGGKRQTTTTQSAPQQSAGYQSLWGD
ncbi:phage DNA ejection protein [Serratia liquefaciens]|uniref:phage DNA ejection protein n=1 Tax=Serratia liquefaciens TaxID=614 RepID=UPI003B435AF0